MHHAAKENTSLDIRSQNANFLYGSREARKAMRRLQPAKAQDIRKAIDRVAADPNVPNNNVRRLVGVPNGFRIRVGDRRVSYTLDRQTNRMMIFEIAPRGGAYR
jgi:mRNA interferase RelE/StbE